MSTFYAEANYKNLPKKMEESEQSEVTEINVINAVKCQLQETLNYIDFLKQSVKEKIILANIVKNRDSKTKKVHHSSNTISLCDSDVPLNQQDEISKDSRYNDMVLSDQYKIKRTNGNNSISNIDNQCSKNSTTALQSDLKDFQTNERVEIFNDSLLSDVVVSDQNETNISLTDNVFTYNIDSPFTEISTTACQSDLRKNQLNQQVEISKSDFRDKAPYQTESECVNSKFKKNGNRNVSLIEIKSEPIKSNNVKCTAGKTIVEHHRIPIVKTESTHSFESNNYVNDNTVKSSIVNQDKNNLQIFKSKSIIKSSCLNCIEEIVISLLSEDDSDSDVCNISSDNDSDGPNIKNNVKKNTDSSGHKQDENKIQNSSVSSQNLENVQIKPVSVEMNIKKSIEDNNKSNKRKLEVNKKTVVKKRKKSLSEESSATARTARYNLFSVYYKIKLKNLPSSISYSDVSTLMKNSGLDYVDILLINSRHKSRAEVSFTDPAIQKKALSLDKCLTIMGKKVKIKPLEETCS